MGNCSENVVMGKSYLKIILSFGRSALRQIMRQSAVVPRHMRCAGELENHRMDGKMRGYFNNYCAISAA